MTLVLGRVLGMRPDGTIRIGIGITTKENHA